ncbi:alkaline phosphatase family protein [Helcobacillus massiliensis]|uniref:Alkaline phosphatase family protein n=1 Tax=Helcobacillus massiliensis TaxID=521392 RepID=A0A839QQK9_9MICO|nr:MULTISPECIES: nucleotide pyrophosphatase/phosphodiesterase family protein [Helcobacillus]MBB3022292.1 hypothetical protein [Helcobacillus massiliensis]MCG7426487.1 alkaline phosphatase family protein [Helcobacillus sp. ACRRO]MCT1556932.1 alkaline phosphatase family protein [Helcobacillus massiliensis]MCT2035321.1 alkaline phosphatase family protein [Helcobacillus massiliensis]MCT2331464.1 alkaline phosphatase family protein [Helcobacillus massiliensis]
MTRPDGLITPAGWGRDGALPPAAAAIHDAVTGDDGARTGLDLVILVDGLGAQLLEQHRAHTPTLRRLAPHTDTVLTTAPSTTAAVLASMLTGLSPLQHGVLGYTVFAGAPGTDGGDRAISQLTGAPGILPERWMPLKNLGQAAKRSGRYAGQVGPARYRRSFLTEVMQRGWEFIELKGSGQRLAAVKRALRRAHGNGVVYVHLAEVDKAGHNDGPGSPRWLQALEDADQAIGALLRAAGDDVRVTITADHGMVPANRSQVLDLAEIDGVGPAVRAVAGEPRALTLRLHGDQDPDVVAARLQDRVAERGWVMTREELLTCGLLGPASTAAPHALERLGDLQVWANGATLLTHSGFVSSAVLDQRGVHGSLSSAELEIPLIRLG